MTPYYEHAGVALYHGDCREVLPAIGPVGADLCMADPPYAETDLAWDRLVDGWTDVARAAITPTGGMWCFGSLRMFINCAPSFTGWHLSQDVVWEKHNGSNFHADRFKRVHELAAFWYREGAAWEDVYKNPQTTLDAVPRQIRRKSRPRHMNDVGSGHYVSEDGGPRLRRSVLHVRSCHGYAIHPTQKPEELVRPLIEYACPPGGLLVAPFAGSGTDLVIAKLSGRRAIGVELDERDCEKAAERLSCTLGFDRTETATVTP